MKRILVFAMAALVCAAVSNAQNDKDAQWNQPYNAFGSKLLKADILAGTSQQDATVQGKITWQYDQDGRQVGYDAEYPESDGSPATKVHEEEDADHRLIENFEKNAAGEWVLTYSEDYVIKYGYVVSGEKKETSKSGELAVTARYSSQFDAQDRPAETLIEMVDPKDGVFKLWCKLLYEFDEQGHATKFEYEPPTAGSDEWKPSSKRKYYIDESGGEFDEVCIWRNGDWYGTNKYYRSFNEFGKVVDYFKWRFDSETKEWVEASKKITVYDEHGWPVSSKAWSRNGDEWYVTQEIQNTFDEYGNRIVYIVYYQELVYDGTKYILMKSGTKSEADADEASGYKMGSNYILGGRQDSLYWVGESKKETWTAANDLGGTTVKELSYVWNEDNDCWVPGAINITETDSEGHTPKTERQGWDSRRNAWYVMYRDVDRYMYTDTVNYILYHERFIGTTPYGERYVCEYDDAGRLTSKYTYAFREEQNDPGGRVYGEEGGEWYLSRVKRNEYAADGKTLLDLEVFYNGREYSGFKTTRAYDGAGKLTEENQYSGLGACADSIEWDLAAYTLYTYNSKGLLRQRERLSKSPQITFSGDVGIIGGGHSRQSDQMAVGRPYHQQLSVERRPDAVCRGEV